MDHVKKKLIETVCQINGLKDCYKSYMTVLEFIRDRSGEITKNFNNFGYTLRLTDLEDDNLPKDSGLSLMERFLNDCSICDSDQGSIVAFRVYLGTDNRNKLMDIVGPENDLEFTGIYAHNGRHDPLLYKPDIGQTPDVTAVDWFLDQHQYLKPEYYSLP